MDQAGHRAAGAAAFNRCWELLDLPERSADERADLLTEAFVSRFHWAEVGALEQLVVAEWMVARAASATGEGALAVRFAARAQSALEPSLPDWLHASVAEGMARAYAAAGDTARREEWRARSEELVAAIADEEDRELIADQLASVPR